MFLPVSLLLTDNDNDKDKEYPLILRYNYISGYRTTVNDIGICL